MAVTRIKNNQITDSTITYQKIASGTLVGSLFAPDLTLNSNLNVIGNLTITGNTSNINAITTQISDPFVVFNNGYTGSLTGYTIGMLVNRNLSSLADFGAVNVAWVWSEADGAFISIATTDTGDGIVSINNSGYANVQVGNLNAVTSLSANSISTNQLNLTSFYVTNFSTGNAVITGGYITGLSNITATTGNVQSWYATDLNSTNGNIITLVANTINATTTTSTILNVTTGNITTLGAIDTTTVNVNATTGNITTLGAIDTTTVNVNATTGNITNLMSTTSVTDNLSSGNAVITGGSINSTPIGNSNSSSGAFTTLSSSGLTTFTDATQSDNAATGAVVVTGGLGVGANLNVAGNVTVLGNLLILGNTTTLNTEILNVEDLNITVAANATSGAEANGAGLTVAGANATFTYLNADDSWNVNKTINATTVNSAQINITNANVTGATVSTLVANNYSSANTVITGGSINSSPIGNVTPSTGSFTTLTTSGVYVANGNIVANSGTLATNYTTGAIVVPNGGGVGITGDLWVQGPSTFAGNIVAGNIQLSGNINVPVGGTFSNTGVFFGNAGGIGALYAGTPTYTALPTTVLQLSGNVDTYAQLNFQNINSGTSASTDIVATADNGSDADGYINLGINSSTFNVAEYPGYYPNDGYLIMHGLEPGTGNLNIHSHASSSVIKFIQGAFDDGNVKAAVTSTGLFVNANSATTSTSSGALVVTGGAGFGSNINVGRAATFNTAQTAGYDFVVKGVNDNTLIWARPSNSYDSVVIGNSATTSTLVSGAKLIVNTTDSILIPVGSTAQRPGSTGGVDTAGMIRFNTSNAQLEFYNGSSWTNTGNVFTVISSETFDGDDVTLNFTLSSAATTASVIVSLNGVLQIPVTAYTVTGTTLTFTQAPAVGDKIEVRRLATTTTVSTFESSNGFVSFVATNSFANINAGTGSATNRMSFDTVGNVTISANLAPSSNVSYDLGTVNNWFKNIFANTTVTSGADIAENYLSDAVYNPGTVLEFGGSEEVTVSMTEGSVRVAGIVTSSPGHVMNGGLKGSTVVSVALLGRVPVNVIGPVAKGDMLISAGYGYARSCTSPVIGSVLGKALSNFNGEKGSVEVVVGRL